LILLFLKILRRSLSHFKKANNDICQQKERIYPISFIRIYNICKFFIMYMQNLHRININIINIHVYTSKIKEKYANKFYA